MRIEVTQEDIAVGAPGNCYFCPVARAVARAVGAARVRVSTEDIMWDPHPSGTMTYRVDIDGHIGGKIRAFDQTHHMDPFSFDLPIPRGPSCECPTCERSK